MLQNDGVDISFNKIEKFLESIGIKTEYMDKRKIVKYLIHKGYAQGVLETYNNYLGANQKYYVPNKKISPYKIIELINSCNGVAVLAHPNTLKLSNGELKKKIFELKTAGLQGIEVLNSRMKLNQIEEYREIADNFELLKTGGSDFHEPSRDKMGVEISEENYIEIKKN